MAAPVGVQLSTDLFSFLKASFSPHFERAFLLFERGGIIQKAVESTNPNSPKSFSFIGDQLKDTIPLLRNADSGLHSVNRANASLNLNLPTNMEAARRKRLLHQYSQKAA